MIMILDTQWINGFTSIKIPGDEHSLSLTGK